MGEKRRGAGKKKDKEQRADRISGRKTEGNNIGAGEEKSEGRSFPISYVNNLTTAAARPTTFSQLRITNRPVDVHYHVSGRNTAWIQFVNLITTIIPSVISLLTVINHRHCLAHFGSFKLNFEYDSLSF